MIVFAQEVPSDAWLDVWRSAGYAVTEGVGTRWKIRSALVTRRDVEVIPLTLADCPSLGYHGSYVAAASWRNAPDGPVVLASVHASPSRAEPEEYGWPGDAPAARKGGGDPRWRGNTLWDSDMVLATLGSLALVPGQVGVLAAGDFNESREYDFDGDGIRLGTWGMEYFADVERLGFRDVTFDTLGRELPTRAGLQLDHVLTSGATRAVLDRARLPFTDPWWDEPCQWVLSDHAPLWFAMST